MAAWFDQLTMSGSMLKPLIPGLSKDRGHGRSHMAPGNCLASHRSA